MSRTLLLVHAHPDDEVLSTGATMAKYAAEGVRVVLVTCTRGELGEVVVEDLAHLHSSCEDRLGPQRVEELAEAMAALGVAQHYYLGGEGRWRDSDMVGMAGNDDPRSFWQADLAEAAAALVKILDKEMPDVLISYDSFGGYGHPDHIKAHLVTREALVTAPVAKVYESVLPASHVQEAMDVLDAAGFPEAFGPGRAEDLPFTVANEEVTTVIDGREHLPAKKAAMFAHRSQLSPTDPLVMLVDLLPEDRFGIEAFRLVGDRSSEHLETDLFAGL